MKPIVRLTLLLPECDSQRSLQDSIAVQDG